MTDPDSLFERLRAASERSLPPIARWNPPFGGDSFMRILADGRWLYRGSEIRRPEMVRLFSTILRRDDQRFVLVTPVECLSIDVDDAPFVALDVERRGVGDAQEIAFETNVGDVVVADASHAIHLRRNDGTARPYVHVRGGLDALVARPAYYRLVDYAERVDGVYGVRSCGVFFALE
jgi:hypothetical protein